MSKFYPRLRKFYPKASFGRLFLVYSAQSETGMGRAFLTPPRTEKRRKNMRKRTLQKLILTLMCACMLLGLTACAAAQGQEVGGGSATVTIGHKDLEDATGLYTNYMSGTLLRDRLVGSWSAVTHLPTLAQYNTLVLTAQNTTIKSGDRYELSKDLYNGEMGIHIEVRFYGEYTFDGNAVTLKIPEYYTWIYYRNGAITGDFHVYEPVDVNATGNDGCSFFGDYLDYHGYHRVEEMTVMVDPDTGAFEFDIQVNDDAAAISGESEDDGFNAGPIFG